MLSNPDQAPAKYIPRIKYPDHLPGFESKEPLNLERMYGYIATTSSRNKKDLLNVAQDLELLTLGIEGTSTQPHSSAIDSIISDLLNQINGDLHNENPVKPKREVAQKYIYEFLRGKLKITPKQEQFFSGYLLELGNFKTHLMTVPPISLVRMIVEIASQDKISEIPRQVDFNGQNAITLYNQVINPYYREKILTPVNDLDVVNASNRDQTIIKASRKYIQEGIQTPPSINPIPFVSGSDPLYLVEKTTGVGGGMAEIYPAWDIKRQKIVRAKKISATLAKQGLADSVELEAKTMARLNHPGIPAIFNIVTSDNYENKYMIMDYVQGPTVFERICDKTQPLSKKEILQIVSQTADIIDYIHTFNTDEHPLFHLDIKPSNLIIEKSENRVKLIDFNTSSWVTGHIRKYDPNTTMGTPAYIAPELIVDARKYTPQADVFSLAVTCYQLLTHALPFSGDTPTNIGSNIYSDNKTPLKEYLAISSHLNINNVDALQTVFNKGLHHDPKMRYNTAGEFAAAFQAELELE